MSIETPEIVTKELYSHATGVIPKLKTLVDALAAIDRETVSNNVHAYAEVQAFKQKITAIYHGYKEVIANGDIQYKNRPTDLINRAGCRINTIQNDIDLIKALLEGVIAKYQSQIQELKNKNFSLEQIKTIAPDKIDEDAALANAKIERLMNDREKLLEFVSDRPEYRLDLIEGIATTLEGSEVLV
ncbi:MAG: hypothetical protein QM500_16365 [Methylococcales bacterium]